MKKDLLFDMVKDNRESELKRMEWSTLQMNVLDEEGSSLLHWACVNGNESLTEWFIQNGVRIDGRNQYGITPLEIAVVGGHENIVNLLISSGADIHQSRDGFNLLHAASQGNHVDLAKRFVELGFDVDSKDENGHGRTPLIWCAQEGSFEVAVLLLESGANPNGVDEYGFTALHTAIAEDNLDIAVKLIELGADVNQMLHEGGTAVHTACAFGKTDALKILIKSGADLEQVDELGQTALLTAAGNCNFEIVKVLMLNGVNIDVKDVDDKGVLDYLRMCSDADEILRLFK